MKFVCPQCKGEHLVETTFCSGVQRTITICKDGALEFGPDHPFGGIEDIQYECELCGWILPVSDETELRYYLQRDHDEPTKTYWQVHPSARKELELFCFKIIEEQSAGNVLVQSVDNPSDSFLTSLSDLFESPIDAVNRAMEKRLEFKKQKDAEHKKAMKELRALLAQAIKRSSKSEQKKA